MKMNAKFRIGALLVSMLLVSTVFVSFGSGLTEKDSTAVATDKSISYTESELRTLYEKYGITENDLKFANDTLPYYLEGTILDSELRI